MFFLKEGDSTNDQPNDNGSNCKLKSYFSHEKERWRGKYLTVPFGVWAFNEVLVAAWDNFTANSNSCIKNSFIKTGIWPLKLPKESVSENIGKVCLASMQLPPGKAATELKVFISKNSGHYQYDSYQNTGNDDNSLETYQALGMKRGKHANRNLLI